MTRAKEEERGEERKSDARKKETEPSEKIDNDGEKEISCRGWNEPGAEFLSREERISSNL